MSPRSSRSSELAGESLKLERFITARLSAERLTPAHLPDLRCMDQNQGFMALLGGVRDEAGTVAYLEWNLAHWAEHGFGLWMLRELDTGEMVGRAVLRHLDVDGVDEVEVGYGLDSLVAITVPRNTASQRVLVKSGLVYERDIIHAGAPHLLFRTRL